MNQKRLVHNNWWIEPVVPLQQANRDSQKGLYYGTNQLVEQSLEHKRAIAETAPWTKLGTVPSRMDGFEQLIIQTSQNPLRKAATFQAGIQEIIVFTQEWLQEWLSLRQCRSGCLWQWIYSWAGSQISELAICQNHPGCDFVFLATNYSSLLIINKY